MILVRIETLKQTRYRDERYEKGVLVFRLKGWTFVDKLQYKILTVGIDGINYTTGRKVILSLKVRVMGSDENLKNNEQQ